MTAIFSMDYSLCWYTFYAVKRLGFLERMHQTIVDAILINMYAFTAL